MKTEELEIMSLEPRYPELLHANGDVSKRNIFLYVLARSASKGRTNVQKAKTFLFFLIKCALKHSV